MTKGDDILEKIKEIVEKSDGGHYLYRGEPKRYENVSSNLYRQYQADIATEDFNIEVVQGEILQIAKKFTQERDDSEILAQLQHYEGKTNLIDFTTDIHIALFFSCDGEVDQDGRVILFKRNQEEQHYKVWKPHSPVNRIIAQKSVFVQPTTGLIDPNDFKQIEIPSRLKNDMLHYLRQYHDISTQTIYNDLHGFIKSMSIHKSAYTEFYHGATYSKQAMKENDNTKTKMFYNKSIESYSEAICINPQLAAAYNNRGVAKNSIGDHQGALNDYNEAIHISPQLAAAYNNRGNTKATLGDHQGALDDYNETIHISPQYANAYNSRGVAKDAIGDHQGALDDYNETIRINPQLAEAYNNRGETKATLGNHQGALDDYNEAIRINPQSAGAYNNRGETKATLGDHQGALDDYNEAIHINPQYAGAYNNRGAAKAAIGDHIGALDDYNETIRINPQFAEAHNNRGLVKTKLGDHVGAMADRKRALQIDANLK